MITIVLHIAELCTLLLWILDTSEALFDDIMVRTGHRCTTAIQPAAHGALMEHVWPLAERMIW